MRVCRCRRRHRDGDAKSNVKANGPLLLARRLARRLYKYIIIIYMYPEAAEESSEIMI